MFNERTWQLFVRTYSIKNVDVSLILLPGLYIYIHEIYQRLVQKETNYKVRRDQNL